MVAVLVVLVFVVKHLDLGGLGFRIIRVWNMVAVLVVLVFVVKHLDLGGLGFRIIRVWGSRILGESSK
jgi:hypothetical protein